MTQKMIDEIAVALNQGLYLVALSAALTLPDVCGKAEYPEERVSTRYKKWYSTFVPDGNLPEDSVYALRCSLLHEGNTNAKDKNDIKFQLMTYANNYEEACNMIEYFKKQGYVFINYSKSNYNYSPYAKYEEDFDTHHVIGQEFDNVLMLMDDSFYYDENGVLQGVPHPNPDYLYPNLFYQGITRVREKIALVIVNSPRLFEKISSIFDIEQEA